MKGKRLDVWRRGLPSEGVFDLLTCLPCCFPSSFPARLEQTAASTLGDRSTNGSLEETFCFMTGAKQYQLVWGQWLHSSWSALSDNPTGNNVAFSRTRHAWVDVYKKRDHQATFEWSEIPEHTKEFQKSGRMYPKITILKQIKWLNCK